MPPVAKKAAADPKYSPEVDAYAKRMSPPKADEETPAPTSAPVATKKSTPAKKGTPKPAKKAAAKRGPAAPPVASPAPTPPAPSSRTAPSLGGGGSYAERGSGFILGLLFWTWIALPFLQGGPTGVKNQLRAKFLNQAADGSPLP